MKLKIPWDAPPKQCKFLTRCRIRHQSDKSHWGFVGYCPIVEHSGKRWKVKVLYQETRRASEWAVYKLLHLWSVIAQCTQKLEVIVRICVVDQTWMHSLFWLDEPGAEI